MYVPREVPGAMILPVQGLEGQISVELGSPPPFLTMDLGG